MGEALQGFVRQHGRHAAGIIIADPDVCDVVPVMRDPGGGDDLVTQFEMKGVEDSGLVKFDFLGLKTTTIINAAVQHVRASSPELANLRSEEHTSELQSLMRISYAVFCLKKNTAKTNITT